MSANLQSASFTLSLQWIEQITILSKTQNWTHNEMNQLLQQLTSSSTPPVALGAVASQTLSGSTYTLDLTALRDSLGNTVDGSNGGGTSVAYRVQFFLIWNTGATAITISQAASNSYPLWGTTYSKTLQPGQFDLFFNLAGGTVQAQVLSTAKNILITGTSGGTFGYTVLFG